MLKIKKEIYDEMIEYCKSCFPQEACGILAGNNNIVTKIYKIKNIENSSVSYLMEPSEQFKAMKDMRTLGLQMLAIFHSHPWGGVYPSGKDRQLAFCDVYYLIVAIEPNIDVKCFKIEEGDAIEVRLITE
uniref:M67 family peptidase n=1 Tax=Thermodesulfovibrio aggregans TaxID=86166 RepID=A0A7C4EMA7_9BACT